MADLAALRRADAAGLTVGPRRHVVVEQEVLVGLRAQRVEQLVHARHGHGDDVHHLGLAALEQARAVRRRQDADLARQRTQVARAATVDAHALLDDPLADRLLGEAAHRLADLALATGEVPRVVDRAGEGGDRRVGGGVGGGVALGLAGDLDRLGDLRADGVLDGGEDVVAVVVGDRVLHRLDGALGGDHRGDELTLQRDRLLDPGLAGLEATGERGLVDLGCAVGVVLEALRGTTGLDHHDRDVARVELTTGDDELERAGLALFVGRVGDPLAALAVGHADGADRTVERDARDHQRRRGGVDAEHVVRVLHVGTEDREHDLDLVAEAVGERRPQRAVGEAAGEDRVLGGTALTTEERAGHLAGGVGTLLDVDGEREEVRAGAGLLGRVRRGEDGGAAQLGDDGALALLGELAGLERQGLVGPRHGARHSDGVGHASLLSAGRVVSRASTVGAAGDRFPVGRTGAATRALPWWGRRGASVEATDNRSGDPLG
ncbi:unannotated protein [freshwater metagenome]|uniref:Unannotated protein n=1 Tax=freshwater metagenome TaxID=449393 RepID=A0A6J6DET9_9ZZZZ